LAVSLKLYSRNTMALVYGYVFPTIFLVAFWVLYRYEKVPLARHMGELLTIAVLGGACFGLPTTMVSERERGVWRRYRLAPVPTGYLVSSTALARYFILISAGMLQVAIAMGLGMPLPRHPFQLWLAFTFVAFAFLGLGLVIAMLADNVPAVQALGQCLFLPMLIIGGIAVPLASLPDWAQHLSAFFPGRYAVDAIQACVTGNGLGAAGFNLGALLVIGTAGCVAGAKLFRWDAEQRFAARAGKGWVGVALLAWVAVGLAAEARGRVPIVRTAEPAETPAAVTPAGATGQPAASLPPNLALSPAEQAAMQSASNAPRTTPPGTTGATPGPPAASRGTPSAAPAAAQAAPPSAPATAPQPAPAPPPASAGAAPQPTAPPEAAASAAGPKTWQAVTAADIDRDFIFTRLPPDDGVVTPIAPPDEVPAQEVLDELEGIRAALPTWKPGKVEDPVQRARNLLYIAAVPDIFQLPMERYVPQLVFDQLLQDIPKDDLIKILYWIGMHPMDGTDSAVDQLRPLGLGNGPSDAEQLRERTAVYAVKLLGRITGRRPAR
jgi:ABC-2 type transporter